VEIDIQLPEPHVSQLDIIENSKRFNIVCCGRRFGKTVLGINRIIDVALQGYPVAWYSPTYKMLNKTWKEIKNILSPIIKQKEEQTKHIELITNGIIDFWSMDNIESSRGQSYKRIICDEVAIVRNFEELWTQAVRPTLTDLRGDAYFLSTPKGINSYFYEMYNYQDKYDNWASWHMPTYANPYIPKEEIDEVKQQLDPIIFKQEYEAEFVSTADKPFLYCFDKDKHISDTIQLNPNETVYLSHDFNVDPCTAIIAQHGGDYIHILDEIRLNNSNIYEVAAHIKSKYPNCHYLITGDASGFSRTTQTKGNINNYTILLKELNVSQEQLRVPRSNPAISESRTLCNAILSNHRSFKIHSKCKYLIEDMMFCQVDDEGQIDKAKNAHQSHLLDCARYYINSFHGYFIRSYNKK